MVQAEPVLTPELLGQLARTAREHGLLALAPVRLDHPGFAAAAAYLERFLAQGRHGTMGFLARSRRARKDPRAMLPGAQTLLVALAPHGGSPGPIARYAQSADYHTVMHRRLDPVVAALREAVPGVEARVCVDTKPVMERTAAVLAGLGFLGKNGCLISPGLGSYVLLGEVLCTARWAGDDAAIDLGKVRWDACGSCTRCLDACPTHAFTAPGELEPRRCISYLTIEHRGPVDDALADKLGERVAGCDVCQEVCPYNAALPRGADAWIEPPPGGPRPVDLVELANLRSGRYRAFVRDTAVRRIPRPHLRRNALLALGNRPAPLTPREHDAATQATTDPDPQIRAAAQRVLRRRA